LAALAACGGHPPSAQTGAAPAQFIGIPPARAAELPAVKDPGHPATGDYDLGLVPPGLYTLEVYRSGYTASPGVAQVAVSTADAIQDFTLTAAPSDVGEPNDSIAAAYAITPDGTVTSGYSVGQGGDLADYYKFDANQGQLVEITVSWAYAWWPGPAIYDVFDPALNNLGGATQWTDTSRRFAFVADATGTYTFDVEQGPVDYSIQVKEQ
jgi:hypothetical protein